MKRSCSHLIAIVTIADCVLIKGWLCLVEFQVWLGLFLGFCSLESKALLCHNVLLYIWSICTAQGYVEVLVLTLKSIWDFRRKATLTLQFSTTQLLLRYYHWDVDDKLCNSHLRLLLCICISQLLVSSSSVSASVFLSSFYQSHKINDTVHLHLIVCNGLFASRHLLSWQP